ncbi:MAG TPA: STAS domain-containing protein [Nonomuraea sp.]|nr:STAS domain-containing protein [Nonomuraea sp.]
MMQLSVRLVPVGETTLVIALTGELDATTRPVLASFLEPLPRSGVKYVVVSAADLWFCDLSGLRQLASVHEAMLAKGGHLALTEARPALCRLVELMAERTHSAIPVYATMPEALAATDVEVYEVPAPPTPVSRHLPCLRNVHPVTAPGGRRRHAKPRPVPLDQALARSRALREQAHRRREALGRTLRVVNTTLERLQSTRERFDANVRTMRDTLVTARSAAAAGPAHGSALSDRHSQAGGTSSA